MSTSTGRALTADTANAVAINVFAGMMTSSPGPMSSASNASRSASNPELTPTAWRQLQILGETGLKFLELLSQDKTAALENLNE